MAQPTCAPRRCAVQAVLLREQESQQAARALRLDGEGLREENDGGGDELLERNAAPVLVLGRAAVARSVRPSDASIDVNISVMREMRPSSGRDDQLAE